MTVQSPLPQAQIDARRAARCTVLWLGALAFVVYAGFIVLNVSAK